MLIRSTQTLTLRAFWTEAPSGTTYTVTVPETTLSDGTVIPGTTFEVPAGSTMTSEQIEQIVNREGVSPDKWVVTYYDPATRSWRTDVTMTTDELRMLLSSLPVASPITIAPAKDAKVSKYEPPMTPEQSSTKGSTAKRGTAKTGDNTMIVQVAIAAAAALCTALAAFFVLRRRRRDN